MVTFVSIHRESDAFDFFVNQMPNQYLVYTDFDYEEKIASFDYLEGKFGWLLSKHC